ncbi:MAG: ABC transporter ATP-binding protein [Parvularculaceae bacterium]|nr:ABC transporter ATP-binding protein [Parvularculaceae bacterium]
MTDALLSVRRLRVTFQTASGPLRVVDDLDFNLRPFESLAVIGESGSGKSVVGHAIMRLLDDSACVAGEVWFQGRDVYRMTGAELAGIRGTALVLIPQSPMSALDPVMRLGAQIGEVAAKNTVAGGDDAQARTMDALDRVGFAQPAVICRSYAHRLSGGMCERVLIAMALTANAALVIADEPTKGLDAPARATVLRLLTQIGARTAVLMITHDLLAASQCARTAVMYGGQLVEHGPTGLILQQPVHPYTRRLLDAQPCRGLKPIPGRFDLSTLRGGGCRFRNRCDQAGGICATAPPVRHIAGHGMIRCHFA